MGILGALSTAVSGLSAQAYALENISGNIANSQTIGFKRVDTNFVDLIPDQPANRAAAGSVSSYSQLTNTLQGTIRTTGVGTHLAINGDGYFGIAEHGGSAANPLFTGSTAFTRRGDFESDAQGYLVNGAGKYLAGTSYDPATGSIVGSTTSPIRIRRDVTLPAKQTTRIEYTGNLPASPSTGRSQNGGSNLLTPSDFATDPTTSGSGTVAASDSTTFNNQSIFGGVITAYTSGGAPATVQTRWAKIADATGTADARWNLFYQENGAATGSGVMWRNVGSPVTFSANGRMTSAGTINVASLTGNGTAVGPVQLDFSGGLTQYAEPNGQAATTLAQDGYAPGTLNDLTISSDGRVSGSYSNGQIVTVGNVTVAHFSANNALKRMDGGTYGETTESGTPSYGLQGTSLIGGSVEESNTDISEEFSKLIITQQAYSANTKVLSTAQTMLQDVINIIR